VPRLGVAHARGVPVICFGIRSDFLGEPFPGSIYLLALADSIEYALGPSTAAARVQEEAS